MESFIRNRIQDRRFNSQPVQVRTGHEVTRWAPMEYHTVTRVNANKPVDTGVSTSWVSLASRPDIHSIQRVNASMGETSYSKEGASEKPKKKKAKTTSKKGSDAGSVTSDGTDNGSCWSNYRRNSKPKYSKGSCEPEDGKK